MAMMDRKQETSKKIKTPKPLIKQGLKGLKYFDLQSTFSDVSRTQRLMIR